MKVCKFGGTCSATKPAIQNIASLACDSDRKVLVFSAIGKENEFDEKLTDLLIEYTENSLSREVIESKILAKITNLLENTKTNFDIENAFLNSTSEFLKTGDKNRFISRGEEWTAQIMAQFLHLPFVSAEKFMFLKNGKIDLKKTQSHLKSLMKKFGRIVVPGFYGIEKGRIKLFSRGGSDVSGAIIAKLLNAQIYENWTDVEGIFQVNPAVCKSKTISKLSYADLALISSHDGKVVHPDCAQILDSSATVMQVRSIFDLQSPPTEISSSQINSLPYICYAQNENDVEIKICKNFNKYKVVCAKRKDFAKIITKEYKKL